MTRLPRALRDDTTEVIQVLNRYLEGRHYGDLEKLRSVVMVSAEESCSRRAPHPSWLVPVSPAPADQGESLRHEILNIDVDGDHAIAVLSHGSSTNVQEAVVLLRAGGAWYIDANRVSDTGSRA